MDGVLQRPGWAWIFILEGIFTIIFGLTSFFILPRSPAHARFLSERERAYVVERLKQDGATGSNEQMDRFSWREVFQAFTLPHVWMLAVVFFFDGKNSFHGRKKKTHEIRVHIGTILFGLA
jgi:sugar phosphate permease